MGSASVWDKFCTSALFYFRLFHTCVLVGVKRDLCIKTVGTFQYRLLNVFEVTAGSSVVESLPRHTNY
jgi:hypothetical protein